MKNIMHKQMGHRGIQNCLRMRTDTLLTSLPPSTPPQNIQSLIWRVPKNVLMNSVKLKPLQLKLKSRRRSKVHISTRSVHRTTTVQATLLREARSIPSPGEILKWIYPQNSRAANPHQTKKLPSLTNKSSEVEFKATDLALHPKNSSHSSLGSQSTTRIATPKYLNKPQLKMMIKIIFWNWIILNQPLIIWQRKRRKRALKRVWEVQLLE